ncbi:hypothetical protein D3C80_1698970 [compost metagenome]
MQVRARLVDRRVDDKAGRIDLAAVEMAVDHVAVQVDQHQVAGAHLLECHAIAVDQEVPVRPGYTQGDVRVDQVGHAVVGDQAIQRSQLAARLPFGL